MKEYKYFTKEDKCVKCKMNLRLASTFCHDCGRCNDCLIKSCKKVVEKQENGK